MATVGGRDMPRTTASSIDAYLLYRTSTFFSLLALGFAQVERPVVRRPGDSARVEKPAALDARAAEEPPPLDAANVSITAERAERARATARDARERRMVSVSRVARGRARRDGRAARCEDVEFRDARK